ncbi:MAG: acyltransferase [Microthrixaceae bacterium]
MNVVTGDGGVMTRVTSLDGVRGLAVLFVLLYHAGQPAVGGFLLQSGVDLFFVLSGFLISTILLRTTERTDYFRNFYGRRFARIFPLYYLVLVIFVAGAAIALRYGVADDLGFPEAQNLIDNQLWGWLYQVNNLEAIYSEAAFAGLAHLWSLSIEEQFYLLWPMVILWLRRLGAPVFKVCIVLALLGMTFRCAMYPIAGRDFAYYFTFCRVDGLLLGSAGAAAWLNPSLRERFTPAVVWMSRRWWVILILLLMPEQVGLYVGFTVISVAYLGLVLGANSGLLPARPTRWLESRLLQHLGKYSYAIYIFSLPLSRAANDVYLTGIDLVDAVVRTLFVGLVSYAVARVSWALWERPWLRLKKRFSYA